MLDAITAVNLDFLLGSMAANKRILYVGGLAEEVNEKILQVRKGYSQDQNG